jgi:hypothetical protein
LARNGQSERADHGLSSTLAGGIHDNDGTASHHLVADKGNNLPKQI